MGKCQTCEYFTYKAGISTNLQKATGVYGPTRPTCYCGFSGVNWERFSAEIRKPKGIKCEYKPRKTVSIELARQLHDAGLKWEPKTGDWFLNDYDCPILVSWNAREFAPSIYGYTWLPNLSDILEELEKRGYTWQLRRVVNRNGTTIHYMIDVRHMSGHLWETKSASTPEEAAGEALLWVLKEGRK